MPVPMTAQACADYLGFTREWIRVAIVDGVLVNGHVVKLEAEIVPSGSRRSYRIHADKFIDFLTAIGWKRMPILRCDNN